MKQAYYLEPEQIGAKAFYLLKSVLTEQSKSAICKIVLKDREQLAALNPFSKTMLLTTLHWPDEVRSMDELNLPEDEIELKASEKKMAEQLVASMTGDFSADDYPDDYREALMAVIEKKVAGEKPEPAERAPSRRTSPISWPRSRRPSRPRDGSEGRAKPAKAKTSEGEARRPRPMRRPRRRHRDSVGARPPDPAGRARRAARPSHPDRAPAARCPLASRRCSRCRGRPVRRSRLLFEPWWPGIRAWPGRERPPDPARAPRAWPTRSPRSPSSATSCPSGSPEDGVLLDGWLLALDEGGWLDTDLLRRRLAGDRSAGRPAFVASDLLWSGGGIGSDGRFVNRRRRLESVLRDGDRCVVSHALHGEGTLLAEALGAVRAGRGISAAARRPLSHRAGRRRLAAPPDRTGEPDRAPALALIQRLPLDEPRD